MTKHARFGLTTATLLALAVVSSPARAQGGSCLAHPDTAGPLVEQVKLMVLAGRDSTRLARAGLLPVDTVEVALVTDTTVCTAAVVAYNREKPAAMLPSAYVIRAGASRYLVWDMRDPEMGPSDIMVFDCDWVLKAWFVG